MPVPTDITAGTLTITNGSTAVTGVGTAWLASDLRQGDIILWIEGGDGFQTPILADVPASNTVLTLVEPWEGPTLTGARYRIRYQWDSSRVSAQSRQLIEMLDNGNVLALSGLTGPGVPVFDGPHSMIIKPESDFINGVAFDVQVDTLADRTAYDGQTSGFAVLVSDVGDGRSAIYSKNSNTSGDWSDPAYITGPASTVPGPSGVTWQGTYASGTEYVANDGVLYNGSSWRALIATTGNTPPTLPTTSNTWWELLAAKGVDGAGTGDMVGPAGATDGTFVGFDGATGKLTKELTNTAATALINVFATSLKGVVPGPTTGDISSGRILSANGAWVDPPTGDLSDLETTVSQIALQVSDNSNVALFLGPSGNRVADSFDTLTYVDVAGATNLNSGTAGVLKPTVSGGVPSYANPGGTGARTGIITTSATMTFLAGSISNLIDGTQADVAYFTLSTAVVGLYLRFNFGSPKLITEAKWYQNTAESQGVWKWQGSNDATSWADIGATFTLGGVVTQTQTVLAGNTTAFRYYQLIGVSGTSTSAPYLREIEFKIDNPVTPNNLTVRSASFTASSVPTKMKALLRVKEVDAAVAGTDYTLECSRDNGTTWAMMPLTEMYIAVGLLYVDTPETSVASQPSGTAPRWRFKTLNNKAVELHDAYLYWS